MQNSKILALAADHAGYKLKESVKLWLEEHGYRTVDFGTHSEASMDYPDVIHPLSDAIEEGRFDRGIIICGSGIGVSMVANKHQGIRCALCHSTELASLARQHNNANVLAMGARFISTDQAIEMVKTFLDTPFEGGRHQRRVEKIPVH
ncbi:MAG TPA: ribose 5-phosphate isomerase B [Bacteroidales bacterium]|nr:MAG: ribose 5-phosphate isomerase B [Bacteroidetes bacterium GWE2_42_24]OFY27340.1 MAG: ribose 5-phosphate isomerase B [Bacteroidetes bacterium GWF2_43_11]PKP18656.1 MAG: ribose 5-phosphate isomerase B [Bacteroidetes bacterium HGW-Bacteroidetes-22]HAQ65035.1 ribose 5-phosphate isomerase B [Bacteroidales bacterium]HBZ65911.1 ribose 5-phosphate isomerase B [Bacteroidales bacterium]